MFEIQDFKFYQLLLLFTMKLNQDEKYICFIWTFSSRESTLTCNIIAKFVQHKINDIQRV